MRVLCGLILSAALLAGCASSPALDEAALIAEAEAADLASMKAQNSGDLETLANYLSEDYAYIDLSGNRIDKAAMLARRSEDKRTIISETPSEDETIVLGPDAVMFRGRTDTVASYYGGLYALETQTPLTLELRAEGGRLLASIENQFTDMEFFPESETHFFAVARPFELVLSEDGCALTLVTFGAETKGKRLVEPLQQ